MIDQLHDSGPYNKSVFLSSFDLTVMQIFGIFANQNTWNYSVMAELSSTILGSPSYCTPKQLWAPTAFPRCLFLSTRRCRMRQLT